MHILHVHDAAKARLYVQYIRICTCLLASERSERDTIRGVQIRACAVYIYIYIYIYMYGGTYAILVAHATHTLCGRS